MPWGGPVPVSQKLQTKQKGREVLQKNRAITPVCVHLSYLQVSLIPDYIFGVIKEKEKPILFLYVNIVVFLSNTTVTAVPVNFGLMSKNVCQQSGRPGFNPRSSHTKDSKNGTWCHLA